LAKATGGYAAVRQTERVVVHCPKDAQLARLLTGSGGLHEKLVGGLAAAADPGSGASTTVTFLAADAGAVEEDLTALLRRARQAGDPAAERLAVVAAQLGVSED
jgi:hypothetical protein